jgi:excinuclease ABC subunit B
MASFRLESNLALTGDQPAAVEGLVRHLTSGRRAAALLGVTGSGKTFTMAHTIARLGKPVLVISHNKTLAAQLYAEFKEFFPSHAVHYFVSYYDYYQPEAYIPQRDIYIEKDADINPNLDRLRLAATSSLMHRDDVIVVASVSCIFGLGSPEDYRSMIARLERGRPLDRRVFLRGLVDLQYERNEIDFKRGTFRIRGDVIELYPSYEETALRVAFDGDVVTAIVEINPTTGEALREHADFTVYPAKHFVLPEHKIHAAIRSIEAELIERVAELKGQGKLLEAQRLNARTRYDMELMKEVGYCKGIENYSRHLSGRKPGERPATLIDYYPKECLVIVDEAHATVPQLHAMYNGDRNRKLTLIEHGFRLPSALDNRPMRFEEWEAAVPQVLFVSATPGPYERALCRDAVVEQIIRPTGLVDPEIVVAPARGQVPHLLEQIRGRVARQERVLVTTLTKRLAEDLSTYLQEEGIRCRYLHSEIQTIDRVQILRELREGKFDALVGVNLLREGLDLPEVSLVAILDADKEGFLRSETSIVQTIGRTARNVNGQVLLYADGVTDSMKRAIAETERRRGIQLAYNREHGITPRTIRKEIRRGIEEILEAHQISSEAAGLSMPAYRTAEAAAELEKEMMAAAEALEFERAAELRDAIRQLRGEGGPAKRPKSRRARRF